MFVLPEGRPALMGVLNVTPDSFSDGGRYLDRQHAVEHALQMVEEGADLVDVGGESTRPGAAEVRAEEEGRRVLPVVEALVARGVSVSIDTSKAEIARQALGAGAVVLNDVTGLRDPAMRAVAADSSCTVCAMHMRGDPRTMQSHTVYADVVAEVKAELMASVERCGRDGIARERIWIDPGIGFSKNVAQNLELLRRLPELVATGYPVLVGASRKSFLGKVLGTEDDPLSVEERIEGTLAAHTIAQVNGAKVLRVHDVLQAHRALTVAAAILGAPTTNDKRSTTHG
ncbi:MAG: dihydropteroate synthase [Fimbriimonadaceae bacterium]|nr:dihydropteroate synthase [Fimbriimonadaceae bacterium]